MTTLETLRGQLEALGLAPGDSVLVRAAVGAVGRVKGGLGEALIGALRDAVGPQGTLVGLAFTRNFPLFRLDPGYVFRADTAPTTGALAKLLLEQPGARRSRHPTNSFVAIGAGAERVLEGHDETAPCFLPMRALLELRGKQVLIGCAESSPGFTTVHWAQHELGLSTRSLLSGRVGVLYEKDGEVRRFRRRDIGGCSRGFARFYSDYVRAGVLKTGQVGRAYAIAVDAAQAYPIEYQRLRRDPRYALCDDALCLFCRGSWLYNKRDMPAFYPRYALHLLQQRVRRKGPVAAEPGP